MATFLLIMIASRVSVHRLSRTNAPYGDTNSMMTDYLDALCTKHRLRRLSHARCYSGDGLLMKFRHPQPTKFCQARQWTNLIPCTHSMRKLGEASREQELNKCSAPCINDGHMIMQPTFRGTGSQRTLPDTARPPTKAGGDLKTNTKTSQARNGIRN